MDCLDVGWLVGCVGCSIGLDGWMDCLDVDWLLGRLNVCVARLVGRSDRCWNWLLGRLHGTLGLTVDKLELRLDAGYYGCIMLTLNTRNLVYGTGCTCIEVSSGCQHVRYHISE